MKILVICINNKCAELLAWYFNTHTVGVSNCAPILVDFSLYTYEAGCTHNFFKDNTYLAHFSNVSFIYIYWLIDCWSLNPQLQIRYSDDVMPLHFNECLCLIYPSEYERCHRKKVCFMSLFESDIHTDRRHQNIFGV